MSALVTGAASITPPVQGTGTNIWVRASTGTSETIAIPAAWRKAYLTVYADGADVYLAFGTSAVTADNTAVTTVASGAFTTHGTGECIKIPSGSGVDVDMNMVSDTVTHFAHKDSGAGGFLRITRTSGRAGTV